MYSKVKATKVGTRHGGKRTGNRCSRKSGSMKVQSKSVKMKKLPYKQILVRSKGNHSVYCLMYDQEAKDIRQAMDILSKYAND